MTGWVISLASCGRSDPQTTAAPVKKKALGYIKAWAKQFEDTGDSNLGVMGEFYDQLRAKSRLHTFVVRPLLISQTSPSTSPKPRPSRS